jgi:hypothetical protein
MPVITFPHRPATDGRITFGTPDRADHCHCIGPWPDGDECARCGHYSRARINRTWQLRAMAIARKRKAK